MGPAPLLSSLNPKPGAERHLLAGVISPLPPRQWHRASVRIPRAGGVAFGRARALCLAPEVWMRSAEENVQNTQRRPQEAKSESPSRSPIPTQHRPHLSINTTPTSASPAQFAASPPSLVTTARNPSFSGSEGRAKKCRARGFISRARASRRCT